MNTRNIINHYRREMRATREQLLAGSQVIETASGPIEYAIVGEGYPMLSIHGGGGGYDQGLLAAQATTGDGFRFIAPSRFGFLRTPLPPDASPAAQADAFADLLNALDVPQTVVLGSSSGGPTALQFALRHPDRTSALVLNVAVCHAHEGISRTARIANGIGWRSDFIAWLMTDKFASKIAAMYGITEEIQARLSQVEKDYLDRIWRMTNPISLRRAGMLNDLLPRAHDYPIERIIAPTLIVHAVDDALVSFSHAEYAAERIPGARLLALPDGGHLKFGHWDEIKSEVTEFLKQHTRAEVIGACSCCG